MEQSISSDLIRGHIDTIILHTLLNGDKFAQQISESIEQKSDGEYKINQATLYSSLKRLENLKFVSSYWYDTVGGRRKYFKLTEKGKNTVDENLSSWSFSRAIIDKLMDCAPQPIYKTQYVEKIVEIEKKESPVVSIVENKTLIENDVKEIKADTLDQEKINSTSINTEQRVEASNQEINFRHIINGLIKATTIKKEVKNQVELESLNKEEIISEPVEKMNLNETLVSTDYNAHKSNNNGKIDFGDLTLKAAKEGYKIRISSKDSVVSEGTLLINKVNVYTAIIMLFIIAIEFTFFAVKYSSLLNINFTTVAIFCIIATLFPVIRIVNYIKNPHKKISKSISADSIFTSSIIVFNLLLITFAINLLCNVDFSNTFTILLSLIIPIVVFLDVVIHYTVKFFISKSTICLSKK